MHRIVAITATGPDSQADRRRVDVEFGDHEMHSVAYAAQQILAGQVDVSIVRHFVAIDLATGTGVNVTADIARIVKDGLMLEYDGENDVFIQTLVGWVEETLHLCWDYPGIWRKTDVPLAWADAPVRGVHYEAA